MNNFKFSFIAVSVFFATSSVAFDEVTENKENNVEKIEVTGTYIDGYAANKVGGASRLDLSIIEIPQSVSVISNAQMADYQLKDINSALDTATGLNIERIETDRTYYTARGFDVTNFQVDGVGLPLTSGNSHSDEDTAIYERVEVIRGANGLMTGVGNPSATVNFIRKRATSDTQISVNGTVGSWNNRRLEVDVSTPVSESVGVRFVAVQHETESYLDRYEKDKSVLYGFVEAELSDSTNISISHSYNKSEATGNLWGANPLYYTDGSATDFDSSINTSADWSYWNVIKNNTVVELNHYFNNNWSLRSTYSRRTTDEDSELFYVYGTPNKDTGLGLTGYASEYIKDDEHTLFDAYISGDFNLFGRSHELVAGINFAQMSYIEGSLYDYTTGNGFPEMPALEDWDGNATRATLKDAPAGSDVSNKQKAVYFTARFNVLDNFNAIVGSRYNDWEATGTSYSVEQNTEAAEFIPYLGLVYQMTPELMAYASYTETFVSQTAQDINDKLLDPVTGKNKEIGIKHSFYDELLIASFAYFDTEQVNVAALDPRTLSLPIDKQRYIGVDGVSSHGYEFEVAGQLAQGLQISAGITDFSISGENIIADYTPDTLIKVAATYNVPKVEGLTLGVNMRWQDDISRDQGVVGEGFSNAGQAIITTQKAYEVVNLMARYEFTNNVSVTVNANNVTDKKYLNSLYWAQSYYGAPTNYSATVTWKL
ncbi:TonB-dependent siderophore receptor [Pseudocolwellia agarivorans]|uniref:TonB-dependent siderophore receptor n=1 Tax=Pseudocolwellia agarivorans TaxID=1911682 RepID=UPI000986779D|nr:TonB-dependent siderophore receptor [Pseudocolwellia agarivorans]